MDAPVTIAIPQQPSLWAEVRAAVRGTHRDYTQGPMGTAILLLAIPMVLEMCMESLFGLVDVYFVSSLGSSAVATVGLTEAMLTIIFAVALGLSLATTAIVARRIGEGDPDGAAVTAVQSIALGIVVSVIVGAIGIIGAPTFLRLMGATPEIVAAGSGYTATILGGSVGVFLLFLINAVFRGAGDAAVAMRALWFANIVNIALCPCLIFGWGPFPQLGLIGAAVGTTIGRSSGVVFQLVCLFNGKGRVAIRREHLRPDWEVMGRIVRVGANGMFQYLIATASWLALMRMVSLFGSTAVAGYTIALRLIVFAILPSWGLSNAAATLVGQNLGAGQPDRAEKSVWKTGVYNMAFLGAVSLVFIIFAGPIIRQFTSDPEVVRVGVNALRFISYGYMAYAWGMVLVQAFNGAGDTATPTLINFCCYWMWQIPLAYALAQWVGMRETGVFLAITVAETTLAVVGLLAFRRGRWKLQKV